MPSKKPVKLTKRAVDALAVSSGDTVVWDRDLPGFGIRVYATGRKVWCVQIRDLRGKPRRVPLGPFGEVTPDAARKKAAIVIDRIKRGLPAEPPPEMKEPTVAEFAERYLESYVHVNLKKTTATGIERAFRLHILPRLGEMRLPEIGRAEVASLHHNLREHSTLANRVILILSGMFRVAKTWEVLPFSHPNPCRLVRKFREEARKRFLSPAEYRKLGKILTKAEAEGSVFPNAIAAIRLLMLTGCRRSEILTLRWDDVDRFAGEIRLREGKTGLRRIPLTPAVEAVLAGIVRKEGNPWVLPGRKAGSHLEGIDRIWVRLRKEAGLKDVHLHDLRHSFASRALALGEGLSTIGDLLGHRDVSTTARYAHLVKDAERVSAARVGTSLGFLLDHPQTPEHDSEQDVEAA